METKFRPCIVEVKRGIFQRGVFHGWFQYDGVRLSNSGNVIGGNVKCLSGLVEFEDGSVKRVDPENIKFEDSNNIFNEVERASREWFDKPKPEVLEKKAVWIYWEGWKSNHDRRIDDAVCSQCGYKHPTVYGSLDKLAQICPWCKSQMRV